jgi:hypothetical protein
MKAVNLLTGQVFMSFSRRDGVFLLLAIILVALYVAASGGGFPLDDSWIHQVYGRNLARTGQWAFIEGIPSAASTSPLYTVLLAAGYVLRLPYTLWTHLIGAVALASCGILAAGLADRLFPRRWDTGLVTGLAVILTWQLIWAGAAGMETPVFAALTLAIMVAAWRELEPRNYLLPHLAQQTAGKRGVLFGVIAAFAMLARPEGVLLAGIAGIAVCLYLILSESRGRSKTLTLPYITILWVMGAGIGFSVAIAPYLLLNLSLTGGLLPNTAAAKMMQHLPLLAAPYLTRIGQMTLPLLVGGQVLLIPGIITFIYTVLRKYDYRALPLHLLPLLWVIAEVMLYAARLPAAYQHGRYVLPALPALVMIGVIGMFWLIQLTHPSRIGRVLLRSLSIATALLFIAFALGLGRDTYSRDVSIINQEQVASAAWINDNLPIMTAGGNPALAIYDIGAVGYFAPRPLLDIAGLLSPEIIPLINNPGGMWAFIQQEQAQYLMAFPDQIPGYPDRLPADAPALCPVFTTNGQAAPAAGGKNMSIYWLAWEGVCPAAP